MIVYHLCMPCPGAQLSTMICEHQSMLELAVETCVILSVEHHLLREEQAYATNSGTSELSEVIVSTLS